MSEADPTVTRKLNDKQAMDALCTRWRQKTEAIFQILWSIANNPVSKECDRIRASQAILDRTHGLPKAQIDVNLPQSISITTPFTVQKLLELAAPSPEEPDDDRDD